MASSAIFHTLLSCLFFMVVATLLQVTACMLLKKVASCGWRDGSAVKSRHRSRRGSSLIPSTHARYIKTTGTCNHLHIPPPSTCTHARNLKMNLRKKAVSYLPISPLFSDSFQSFYIPMQKDPSKTQALKSLKNTSLMVAFPCLLMASCCSRRNFKVWNNKKTSMLSGITNVSYAQLTNSIIINLPLVLHVFKVASCLRSPLYAFSWFHVLLRIHLCTF